MSNKKGQFKKGHEKLGGRTKGTKNKVNAQIKERIKNFIDNNYDNVLEDLKELDSLERVRFYLKLLEFVLPKQKSIDLVLEPKNEIVHVTFTSPTTKLFTSEAELLASDGLD